MEDKKIMANLPKPKLNIAESNKLHIMIEQQRIINAQYYNNHWFGWLPKHMRCLLLCVAMIMEVCEYINWLPWKWWRKSQDQTINEVEAKYELIDILHFLISLCLEHGMNEEEIYTIYMTKAQENIRRQQEGY